MDPPERRDQERVEALEGDRLPAARRVAGRGDRARDLRPLELVGEDPGRLARPGLDAVEDEDDERERDQRERRRTRSRLVGGRAGAAGARAEAVVTPRSFRRGAEDHARIEVDLAPDEPAGDLGRRAGVDDRVERLARRVRDRHEDDVGARALRARRSSSRVVPSTLTPWTLRRRRCGLSSTKPTTRSPAVSRSSRIMLAAGAAGADDQRAARRAVAHRARPDHDRPLGEPRAGDRDHADQRVDDEERTVEVVAGPG